MEVKNIIRAIEENTVSLETTNKSGEKVLTKIEGIKIMEGRLIIPKEERVEHLEENILENDNFLLSVYDSEGKGYKIEGFARCENCGEELEFIKNLEENLNKEINGAIILTPMNTEEISWQA